MNVSTDPYFSQDPLLERLNEFCRSQDMQYSDRRWRVALKLREMNRDAEAEEVWISMKSDGYAISISCVYQSLGILTDARICICTKVTNRQWVYRIHPDFI